VFELFGEDPGDGQALGKRMPGSRLA
jgi:hypothetical protein